MEVQVNNLQKKLKLNSPKIIQIVKSVLKYQGLKTANLSIVFVSSQKIRALNKKFLKRNYSTDVLAFNLGGNGSPKKGKTPKKQEEVNGDIVISTDAVIKNALEYGTTQKEELILYLVHGILHLLGYADYRPADIKRMRKKEQEILDYLRKKSLLK